MFASAPPPRARTRRHRALVGGSVAVLLPVPTMAISACGGTDAPAVSAKTAQSQLVAIADRLDACYAERGDARKCTSEDAIGRGAEQVAVTATRPTRYQLTLKVDDRTSFAILAQPVGARKRVCAPAGAGGCPKRGVW